ncbi:MAG: CBS domain-containing protein [Rhodospirillales bacterium]|jgi:CBS domain-containing protein|nr:CBS domain-containing protein [Rhodospirillales bacterium]MDP6645064.1 CBS domain-containing protein [Rhodospirillales bacterium]MDP6843225.1 CBS domain-containing protein [Rhodospirillales bacterium]
MIGETETGTTEPAPQLPNPWDWTEEGLDGLNDIAANVGDILTDTSTMAAAMGFTDSTAGGSVTRAFENAVDGIEHTLDHAAYALETGMDNAGGAFLEEMAFAGYADANADGRTGVESSADVVEHLAGGAAALAGHLIYESDNALLWGAGDADAVYAGELSGISGSHFYSYYNFHQSYADSQVISGNAIDDVVVAFGTAADISTAGGDDIVSAYGGHSGIYTGADNDEVTALGDHNWVYAGSGDDTVFASGKNGGFFGEDGNDDMNLAVHYSLIEGGLGNDTITIFGAGIGIIVVVDDSGKFCGMLSDRDIVRAFGRFGAKAAEVQVGDIATRKVTACVSETPLAKVQDLMKEGGFRHMPVVEDGGVKGIISIGDILGFLADRYAQAGD